MHDHDKNSFFARPPFEGRQRYLVWLKFSAGLLLGLIVLFAYLSFNSYQNYQTLVVTRNSLLNSAKELDEIIRKKNKLLAQDLSNAKYSGKSLGVHAKIVDYLKQIEKALLVGVQLNSFEYTAKKIEITGDSCSIQSLSNTIQNLHKLAFVKGHELQQVANSGGKLVFTIALNL